MNTVSDLYAYAREDRILFKYDWFNVLPAPVTTADEIQELDNLVGDMRDFLQQDHLPLLLENVKEMEQAWNKFCGCARNVWKIPYSDFLPVQRVFCSTQQLAMERGNAWITLLSFKAVLDKQLSSASAQTEAEMEIPKFGVDSCSQTDS